jgi:DNA-binding SARP family transcriptional activator
VGDDGVEFLLLGAVEARLPDRRIDIGHARQQCVLVALLLEANTAISADQLVDRVWGGDALPRTRETLYSYLSRLRRALAGADDAELVRRPGGYVLAVHPARIDVHRFHCLLAQAREAGDDECAAAKFAEAIALWRGEAFATLDTAWINATREALEAERFAAELDLADLRLRLGQHTELLAGLIARTETHPLDERLAAQLLLAWYRSGRQAEALAHYERLRRRLADDLGAAPGPVLRRLHQQILTADPTLAAPPAPTAAAVPVPRQLPAPPRAFTGRGRELAELEGDHDGQAVTIIAIDGMAGVGKSALAIHAGHRLADRFPDGQLYVDLHGATAGPRPLQPLEVLSRFLRALGTKPSAVPTDLEEASGTFRSRVADRRLLVVLDNAADAAQIAPLLPAGSGCRVLVTSRRVLSSLAGVRHLHLDSLPPEEAIELLARVAGRDRVAAEPGAAAEVARWCAWLPLALRIAGARLAMRPGWPVATLAERLADAQHRLDELELAAETGMRASYAVSYQQLRGGVDAVDRVAAEALRLLGVLDGRELSLPVAARLLDVSEELADRVLERLVDAQLLETPSPGRYQMHELLRLYARELVGEHHPGPQVAAALQRVFSFYVATAWNTLALLRPGDHRLAHAGHWRDGGLDFQDDTAALAWLEAENGNLTAAVRQASATPGVPATLATQLTHGLYGFLWLRGQLGELIEVNQIALEVAGRLGDRAAEAQAHNDLGTAYWRQGHYDQALASHLEGLAIREELGDRRGQAASLNNLAIVHRQQGREHQALACQRDSLEIFRELGDRHGQALGLRNLAFTLMRLGRHQQALAHGRGSLEISRELGDRQGQAWSLLDLGIVHGARGDHQQALDCLQDSLRILLELGDRLGQAYTLNNLGIVHSAQGDHQWAVTCQRDSLRIHREQGEVHGEAETLRDLGTTLWALDRRDEARVHWRQALAIFERMQAPEAGQVRELLAGRPAAPRR